MRIISKYYEIMTFKSVIQMIELILFCVLILSFVRGAFFVNERLIKPQKYLWELSHNFNDESIDYLIHLLIGWSIG